MPRELQNLAYGPTTTFQWIGKETSISPNQIVAEIGQLPTQNFRRQIYFGFAPVSFAAGQFLFATVRLYLAGQVILSLPYQYVTSGAAEPAFSCGSNAGSFGADVTSDCMQFESSGLWGVTCPPFIVDGSFDKADMIVDRVQTIGSNYAYLLAVKSILPFPG